MTKKQETTSKAPLNEAQEEAQGAQEQTVEVEMPETKAQDEQDAEASAPAEEKDPLEAAQEEIDALKDQILRRAAEFDNYRKRVIREKALLIETGGQKVIEALLPVLDDFARAEENMQKSDDIDALREGVNLISAKLQKALAGQGLKAMEVIGEKFDTDFHEAIALVPVPEDEKKGTVIDCVQTGYTLGQQVIRHAKVVVGQ